MFQKFLSVADADRALHTFCKLARHEIGQWAVTGGFAIEIHHWRLARQCSIRSLNDIDFIARSFECIPQTLADDFLFRHIHPLDPPGKTMMQLIDPERALRIDVFRASGAIMDRTFQQDLQTGTFQLVSVEDLVAREARLTLDLAQHVPVPSKHAKDFLRLIELVDAEEVETAWKDHRSPQHPVTFAETKRLLQDLIQAHPELLVTPCYSNNTEEICTRCNSTSAFQLADPKVVLSLLGYC
jgi:hypothetical protein